MTLLDLLTIPGLDGSEECEKMIRESKKRMEEGIRRQKMVAALMNLRCMRANERGLPVEEREEGMTKDEMQRLVDEEMEDSKSYEEALKELARVIGIHSSDKA